MTQHHDPVHPDDGDDVREPLPTLSTEDEAFLIGLLGALPPVEMPADVAANLDAALARESAERAATGAAEPAPGSATVVPLDARRGQRRTRVLQAAAAVVLVVAGGAVAVSVLNRGGSSSGAGGSSNAAAVPASVPFESTGHTYTAQTLDADVQQLAAGTLPTAPARTDASGGVTSTPKTPSGSGPTPTTSPFSATPPPMISFTNTALVACLTVIKRQLETTANPVVLDRGVYAGQGVLVVVLPGSQDAAHNYDVFIVGATCGEAGNDDMLVYQSVPKP